MIDDIICRFGNFLGCLLFIFVLGCVGIAYADESVEPETMDEVQESYEDIVENTENDREADGADDALEAVLSDYDTRLSAVEEVVMPLADYDTYDGTISTTYTTYFGGIVEKLGSGVDYVLFRSGQYNYVFAYGEMEITGSRIAGQRISCVYVDTRNGTNVSYGVEQSFSVDLGGEMAYSSLGDYPVLQQGVKSYENQALIVAVCVLFLYVVCRDIFKAVRRIG